MDFDTILKDPKYQAEFDKRIAKAIETAKGKWDEEAEAARKEMEEITFGQHLILIILKKYRKKAKEWISMKY